jgi:predicted  nucleic acid-binding Zn-ribbon protein
VKGGSVSTIEKLLVVQEHDSRILQLEKEMRDVPARKERELERLKGHKAALEEAEDALKAKQSALKQFEVETGSKNEKIAKLRGQQLELKTNKEFKAMDNEIAAIERSIKTIEDGELAVMEAIESVRAGVEENRKELAAEDAEVQVDIKDLDERLASLQAELNDEQADRTTAVEGIDSAWVQRYDSIFKSKGGRALVSTANGVCGGCFMTLPPYLRHDAKKRLDMVVCGFCGRLLY